MNPEALEVFLSIKPLHVRSNSGELWTIPNDWVCVPPGDPALSRRIKKDGPSWSVKEKKGRRTFSKGIWAPEVIVGFIKAQLEKERLDPSYQKKLDAGQSRRAKEQEQYGSEFKAAVICYLGFHDSHGDLSEQMATQITEHAIPVGSGTVARTKRIPIEQRAEAATIAWMRHQTTTYDHMSIRREKGARRNVRRSLAGESIVLLKKYRDGCSVIEMQGCLLLKALSDVS
jgi:hypothetical protein